MPKNESTIVVVFEVPVTVASSSWTVASTLGAAYDVWLRASARNQTEIMAVDGELE